MLRVYKILENTKVEGPNERFCIWFQGCKKRCDGCFASEIQSFEGGEMWSVDDLFEKIKLTRGIEGVTFLGGEPFEQAKELALLAEKIKSLGLSIVAFSGYYLEELRTMGKNVNKLLSCIDLLIDGPFEKDKFDLNRPWVGSSNQNYHFLTDKYSIKDINKAKNKVEVRIEKTGRIFINGMGDFHKIKREILEKMVK